jgi:hypothetical protein
MPKTASFTTITPLPAGITRKSVRDMYHDHLAMIDLNPLVVERFCCRPPSYAPTDEYYATWYTIRGMSVSPSHANKILILPRQGLIPPRWSRTRVRVVSRKLSRLARRPPNTCLCTTWSRYSRQMDNRWIAAG